MATLCYFGSLSPEKIYIVKIVFIIFCIELNMLKLQSMSIAEQRGTGMVPLNS